MPYSSETPQHALVEVLDIKNRPLCALTLQEILKQGLPHRAFAVLATDRQNLLLKELPGSLLGTTYFGPVLAGKSSTESAESLSTTSIYQTLPDVPELILPGSCIWDGCPVASVDVFIANISSPMLHACSQPGFRPIHIS